MNPLKLTFTANEQTLTKTDNFTDFASNTVSYIEATFTLGENWTGYDSVRAVWKTDYYTISTVLDANFTCVVPTEVLRYKAKVFVNMVGSIVENDTLTDRLTTFPVLALTVKANAAVNGSETAPVTPSQFEQFVDTVRDEAESISDYSYDSEAWAVGTRGGVDVPSTDQTYHNNSKYWAEENSGLADDVADLKSDLNKVDDAVFVGSNEREILNTSEALTRNNNPIAIGEALSSSNQYMLEVSFTNTLSHLSGIRLATSSSGSTQIETLSPNVGTEQDRKYIFSPTTNTATYIHIEFNSGYSRTNSAMVKLTQINVPREASFYKRDYVDGLAKHGNRFDSRTCVFNAYISASTGDNVSANHRVSSDYIDVHERASYTQNMRALNTAFYNQNKEFLSIESVRNAGRYSIPSSAYYMRLCLESDNVIGFILTFDDETTNELRTGVYSPNGYINLKADKEIAENRSKNYGSANNIINDCAITSIYDGSAYIDHELTKESKREIVLVTTDSQLDCRVYLKAQSAFTMSGLCAFEMECFVEDISKLSSFILYSGIAQDTLGAWSAQIVSMLKTGWNKIRIPTYLGNLGAWTTDNQYFTLRLTTTNETKVHVSSLAPIYKNKARIIVVDDHGYHNFLTEAYPQLKALGIPTTWGIQPANLGTVNGEGGYILTQAEIDVLADDPYSEFSFHSWDGSSNATTSNDSNMVVMQKCITYLRQHGILPIHPWRSAWVQNTAAHPEGIKYLLEGGASYDGSHAYCLFPFDDVYNIPRYQIHGRNQSWFDDFFDTLKKTHCDVVVYTHSIVETSENHINMTTEELEMFLDGCETGVTEEWLEGTTFNRLMLEYYADKMNAN